MSTVTGLVLAGGRSTRMGQDKARLRRDGSTLLDRSVACLERLCDQVLVASGDGIRLPGPWRQVADVAPDAGPVAGLLAGLAVAESPLVAVLAVDLPRPSAPLLGLLRDRWDGSAWAVVPRANGHLQPLHAVYATQEAARVLERAFAAGERSLTQVLRRAGPDVHVMDEATWQQVADASFAENVNDPHGAEAAGVELPQPSGGSAARRRPM